MGARDDLLFVRRSRSGAQAQAGQLGGSISVDLAQSRYVALSHCGGTEHDLKARTT